MVSKIKKKQPSQSNQNQVETKTIKPEGGKLDAQKFFDFTMAAVRVEISNQLLPIKRDISDLKFMFKKLRKQVIDDETEFKALGLTLAELGFIHIDILNSVKNYVRDRISVVRADGNIMGKVIVQRYHLIPANENILMLNSSNENIQ